MSWSGISFRSGEQCSLGVWCFIFAGIILYLSKEMGLVEMTVLQRVCAFLLMWIVIGNLNAFPMPILWYAIPLSVVEVGIAGFICKRIGKRRNALVV